MGSRLLRRLRRRAKRMVPTWRIMLYDEAGRCQEVEVIREVSANAQGQGVDVRDLHPH